ncbi:IMV membrane protein [Yokapox virus]|uniref:Cell surface-binding protein OPG105 n=1 Tax=Yokapox virus TaxID=1076255 RepID=G3EIH2_9POXV|nr:IMV membrane protein [Yokapox virus]AEN03683.1 IMV membrane protein [Yokapox virus]
MDTQNSPINIDSKNVIYDNKLESLYINYEKCIPLSIKNNKSKVTIKFDKNGYMGWRYIKDKYILHKMNIYWGKDDDYGSNHLVDVNKYSGELNLIHWNNKYNSYKNAKQHTDDGIVIISIFLKTSNEKNFQFQKIVDKIESIKYPNYISDFTNKFITSSLVPKNRHYWLYNGKDINNKYNVIWIIFSTPLYIKHDQLAVFRHMVNYAPGKKEFVNILENYKNPHKLKPITRIYSSTKKEEENIISPKNSYFTDFLYNIRDKCFYYYNETMKINKFWLAVGALCIALIITYIIYFMNQKYSREKQN